MRNYSFDGEPYVVIERHEAGIGPFLLGALVGAGVALLLAPRAGDATREMIGDSARRVRDRVLDAVDDAVDAAEARAEEARAELTDHVHSARDAVRRRTRQVVDAVEAGRAAAHEARSELERRIAQSKAARRQADGLGGAAEDELDGFGDVDDTFGDDDATFADELDEEFDDQLEDDELEDEDLDDDQQVERAPGAPMARGES